MPEELSFDVTRTAMLCMDYQAGIVYRYIKDAEMTGRAAKVLAEARKAGMRIIYVQVGFRPGLPELSARNRLFSSLRDNPEYQKLFTGPGGAIHGSVTPENNEVIVTKHRVSAFAGTDLDMILRSNEIDTLILFGISTSGVVLSTLLEAADADYRVIVVRDCCADLEPELEAALFDKLFVRRAEVVTADQLFSATAL